jgi:hypothetical protein
LIKRLRKRSRGHPGTFGAGRAPPKAFAVAMLLPIANIKEQELLTY